jgi:hypothetical protein
MVLAKVVYLLATDSEFSASFRKEPEQALADQGLALDAAELSILQCVLQSAGDRRPVMDVPDGISTPWVSTINVTSANPSAV